MEAAFITALQRPRRYEYLDHTADLFIHSLGDDFSECVEQALLSIARYMYPVHELDARAVQPTCFDTITHLIEAEGHSIDALLYQLLSELLVVGVVHHCAIINAHVEQVYLGGKSITYAVNHEGMYHINVKLLCVAVTPSLPRGTEVKAVTKQGFRIALDESDGLWHLHMVVDI